MTCSAELKKQRGPSGDGDRRGLTLAGSTVGGLTASLINAEMGERARGVGGESEQCL